MRVEEHRRYPIITKMIEEPPRGGVPPSYQHRTIHVDYLFDNNYRQDTLHIFTESNDPYLLLLDVDLKDEEAKFNPIGLVSRPKDQLDKYYFAICRGAISLKEPHHSISKYFELTPENFYRPEDEDSNMIRIYDIYSKVGKEECEVYIEYIVWNFSPWPEFRKVAIKFGKSDIAYILRTRRSVGRYLLPYPYEAFANKLLAYHNKNSIIKLTKLLRDILLKHYDLLIY